MPYGITSAGWVSKPLETIDDEVDADLQGILGEGAGTEPDGKIPLDSYGGQIKTLIVDPIAELWDLGEAIYASGDRNQANDASLDALSALTGSVRNEESYSQVTLYLAGLNSDGLVLPAGRQVKVDGTQTKFVSREAATFANPPIFYQPLTAYDVGDFVFSSNGDAWQNLVCTVAGVSDVTETIGAATIGATVVSGTATFVTVSPPGGNGGTETYQGAAVTFYAQAPGPVAGPAGRVTDIATPVTGWDTAYNVLDATVGSNYETNPVFRARTDAELAGQGSSTPDGIRAAVLRVNNGSTDPDHQPPTVVKVFYNDSDFVDANGLPPHSVEVLVRSGTDADIAQAIFDSVAAGTATFGNQSSTVVDSEGQPHTVRWSRPEEVQLYVAGVLRYDPSAWPEGSELLVAQYGVSALLTYTNDYPIARDVRVSPLNAGIMRGAAQVDAAGLAVAPAATGSAPVPGLLEVESLYIGTSPNPVSSAQVIIQARQVAVFDSSRVSFTATSEEP